MTKKNTKNLSKTNIKVENISFEDYLNIEKSDVNYKRKKAILTITIDEESHQKLKRLIPEGEVSKFAEKIIKQGIRKIEEKIFCEYAELDQNEEYKQIKKVSI